jgi:putative ABC transport system permease protein
VLVLRRLVEQGPEGIGGWFASWWARRLQLAFRGGVAALGGIAWALSDSAKVGGGLPCCSRLRWWCCWCWRLWRFGLRFLLNRVRLRLPSFLRHGLANLYRPGNQSAAVLAALGTGVMLILAVYLMQAALLRDLRETASPKLPNVFLIDVTTDEVAG